jgi:drug/metabolite transporter (DMT)-like permease
VANPVLNIAGLGVLIGLGAAITYTIYILVSTRVLDGISGEIGSFYVMGAASLSFLVSNLFTKNFHFGWNLEAWIWVLLITVISTFIAITTFFQGMKKIGPSRSSILSSIELVTSVLVASLVFNEMFDFTQLVGGVLIFLVTIITAFKK